ncbi:MAG: adenylate/guanylate cyclase domain-containing protein [Acidimicrobiia bacterium]
MRVLRCFAFVDMCGFTRMNDTLGDDEALQVLTTFRSVVRGLSPDHATRVGKWLGDGCMFVATDVRPIVDTVLDLVERMEHADIVLPLRVGIAAGKVIIFEGDDFIGMSINLASRLCDAAAPGEVLVSEEVRTALGDDYPVVSLGERQLPGIVAPFPVWRLDTTPELEDDLPLSFVE